MKPVLPSIISNREVMPDVYLLRVAAPEIASAARPGQFVMVRSSDRYERLLRRPLGVHRVGGDGEIELLYDVVGKGTLWLSHRKPGDPIDILGPLGNWFDVNSQRLLLVAGGVGIAPLIFLAERALSEGVKTTLLFGAKTTGQVYPNDLLPDGIEFVPVTQDGLLERQGLVTDIMGELGGDIDQIFACGPVAMYKAMADMHIVKSKHVQVSMEARMGCGFGACYGCTIETKSGMKRVCSDGPVFELDELVF